MGVRLRDAIQVFAPPGVPRGPYEKTADAAPVHRYTGAPPVTLHLPSVS